MFLGQLQMKNPEEGQQVEKKPEEVKSSSSEQFLKTPETREFIKDWSSRMRDGKQMYSRAGITELLRNMHQSQGLKSDKEVLATSANILSMLTGMGELRSFLAGWKAKSEGIIKSVKSLLGK